MKKKLFSYTAIVVLLTSLVTSACSSQGNAQEGSTTPQIGSKVETDPPDPLGKYSEPITVTEVLAYGPPPDPKTPKGLTPDKNGYVKQLKEMLNIDLKYLWTVPTEQFDQKFSLAVASGDLPDVMVLNQADFEKFKEQGMLADLTEAYEKYASPTLKKYMESDGGNTMKMFTSDNKVLGIPSFEDPYMSSQILWIRTDWLKNLNMEPPKSMEDLERIAEAFVKNDPDKNGKNDTYGIAMNKDLITWGFDARGFFNTIGAYPKAWIKGSDGKLLAGEIQPETKTALEKLQSWYKKGILDKEFAFKDVDKVVEDVVAGKVGIAFGEWWYPGWPLNLNKDKDPNAEWAAFPLPTYEGKPGKSLVPKLRFNSVVVVNKKFKHPEAAIKMINFYSELELPKYKDLNKPENGFVYNWFLPRIYNPNNIDDVYTQVNAAINAKKDTIESDNPDVFVYFDSAKKYLAGDKTQWGAYTGRIAENGGWGLVRQIRDQKLVVFNEYAGPATATQMEKGASLDKLTDETFTKIILGSSPISDFDKYVESWKKLGGDDIAKEVNDWYQNNSGK